MKMETEQQRRARVARGLVRLEDKIDRLAARVRGHEQEPRYADQVAELETLRARLARVQELEAVIRRVDA